MGQEYAKSRVHLLIGTKNPGRKKIKRGEPVTTHETPTALNLRKKYNKKDNQFFVFTFL